ncbi:uncharacterized protein LOC144114609 [Amblyomma americanum]
MGMAATTKPMGDRARDLNDVKCVIRALLVVNNGPTTCAALMKDYRTQEGCQLPYVRFGYTDCVTFLESLPDTVHVQRVGDDVLISAKLDERIRHIQTLVQAQKARDHAPRPVVRRKRERPSPPQLPEAVLENILKLLREGDVHARVLRDAYYRRFGVPLDIEQYGFASLEDCLARVRLVAENEKGLPEAVVAVLAQYPEGIYMSRFSEAFARERGRPPTSRTIALVQRWPQLFRVQKPDSSGDFILQPAISSAAILLPPEPLPVRSSVRVTDVCCSPAALTVALLAPVNESPLALLGAAMDHFYGPTAFGPPFDAKPGRPCAALCAETWRRARVVTVTGNIVQVELVDVGGRQSLAPHRLRPLAPRFTELPALCTMATLTLPPGTRAWCKTAGERLRELTKSCQLTCLFDGTRFELQDEQGLLLTRQLASEGLCKPAWRRVTLSDEVSFNVLWLDGQRYIFSYDLSRLVGRAGDSALEELQRRGIRFQCVHLYRNSELWYALGPLLGTSIHAVRLFPADNIADAVNILCYPHTQVAIEVRRELAKFQDS